MFPAQGPEARARASENDSRVGRIVRRPPLDWRDSELTDDPIDLDGRRSVAGQLDAEMRRRTANSRTPFPILPQPHLESLEDQMLAEPARTWTEVMKKWRFLLDRYAKTPEAEDERIQKLIKRALGDMERLRKREERK
jgi:hypothetical protein